MSPTATVEPPVPDPEALRQPQSPHADNRASFSSNRPNAGTDADADKRTFLPQPPGLTPTHVEIPARSLKNELAETLEPVRSLFVVQDDPFEGFRGQTLARKAVLVLFHIFPVLEWGSQYKLRYLLGDVMAGLTSASLAVPQDLAYASLARVPPINGLYCSIVPPVVYAVLGTSRHIAIGPTAVLSLLVSNLALDHYDADTQPTQYLHFVYTITFFSGVIQAAMGVLRLGFLADFLSHAAVIGLMAGAAVTIAASQLKGLLGYTQFTNNADIVSVLSYVFSNTNQFNWRAFLIGISFLLFLSTCKILSMRYKKVAVWGRVLFYLNALGPLIAVVVSTLCVYLTKCNLPPANVPTVKKMPRGVSQMSSAGSLMLTGADVANAAAAGIVAGFISLTEAIVIARTFASIKGYHIDGSKEMIAYGAMNISGSLTSAFTTTGSISRSAINYNAGGETMVTNAVMSLAVLLTVLLLTPALQYLPTAVLSAIIINAVFSLIDFEAIAQIWETDKLDILVLSGTFVGVIFISIEFGLLIGVAVSMLKLLLLVTRPHVAALGHVRGTPAFRNVRQYPRAEQPEGILALLVDAPLCFANANYVRERVLLLVRGYGKKHAAPPTHVVLDLTAVADVDTTGVHALADLLRQLQAQEVQMGISNPSRLVLRKLQSSGLLTRIGRDHLFLSVGEATHTFKSLRCSGVD